MAQHDGLGNGAPDPVPAFSHSMEAAGRGKRRQSLSVVVPQGCTPALDERFAVGSPRTIAKKLRE
jgi:hypothetical protein